MRFGLRMRLLLPLVLLMIGIIMASLWSLRIAADRAERRIAHQIRDVADTLQKASYPLTPAVLEQIGSFSGAELLLLKPDGTRLATFTERDLNLPSEVEMAEVPDERMGPRIRIAQREYHCRGFNLREPHPAAGSRVYIFYPESLLTEVVNDAVRPSLLGLVLGLLAVLLTLGISQRLVGRIRDLDRRTRQIAAGNFAAQTLPTINDEIRDVCLSLNEMARQLDELQQVKSKTERTQLANQLAAGLAHQLRNSATGARLAIEVHASEHPAEQEGLEVALRQLKLMETNIRRFIDLSRPQPQKKIPLELYEIVVEVVELYRPRCRHQDVELHWQPQEDRRHLMGDPDQLRDLFSNLVSNAIDAAGPGGWIRIHWKPQPDETQIEIIDSGPGPPEELIPRLFEPFATGKPEGIGLGLAVARMAAHYHGGTLTWERQPDCTVFRVKIGMTEPPVHRNN